MFGTPGIYGVLVGSGVSSAAGVLTGERIIDDLIRRVARSSGADSNDSDTDPRKWWEQQTGNSPRYDALLEALAPTDAARQALLRSYFEVHPTTGEAIEPTAAHHALAQLCLAGYVRVVLTTNFDNLIERALEAAGVTAQVLSITVGWSAEWDIALTDALERSSARRYPAYWTSFREELTGTARRLIRNKEECEITSDGAEEFLPDLVARVDRLADRARRQQTPTVQRDYLFPPEDFIPAGWTALPLLVLRMTALVTPVDTSSVGLIGPEQRERLLAALATVPFMDMLAAWNSLEPQNASKIGYPHGVINIQQAPGEPRQMTSGIQNEMPAALPLVGWQAIPKVQSTDMARYRLGGEGDRGVSVLADVRLPQQGHGGVLFQVDVGISLLNPLTPWAVAQVLRDGLLLVSASLPSALEDILPGDADVSRCDVHLVASQSDGNQGSRENNLEARIDFSPFHSRPNDPRPIVGRSLGFGAYVAGGLTAHEASELILAGINYMVLAAGFLDPRPALAQLRGALGLPAAGF
jgi:hypothetical protein